jgi:hypothetical protein
MDDSALAEPARYGPGGSAGDDPAVKHEPAGDIDTAVVDSLKALDLERPIREADISWFQKQKPFQNAPFDWYHGPP